MPEDTPDETAETVDETQSETETAEAIKAKGDDEDE